MLELSLTSQTYVRKQSEAKKLKHMLQNFVWFCMPSGKINELTVPNSIILRPQLIKVV